MKANEQNLNRAVPSSWLVRNYGPLLTREGARYALVACVSVACMLVWVDRSVTAQLERNGLIALFLSLELQHETAANLPDARESQAKLLKNSILNMESPTIRFVGWLHPDYSPTVRLTPAVNVLTDPEKPDRAALDRSQELLAQAGVVWSRGKQTSASVWTYDSHRRLEMATAMMSEFKAELEQFNKSPTFATAEAVCLKSRIASAALLTAWVDCPRKERAEKAKHFADELDTLHLKMERFARSSPIPEESERLLKYSQNIESRAFVFQDMRSGGILAGRNRLLTMLAKH